MRFLFDASALLNTIRDRGGSALPLLRGNHILSLTVYEVGNAVWKESRLLGLLAPHEAALLLHAVLQAMRAMIVVEPRDWELVLRLATATGITFYDAAYVVASHENNAILVTDDRKLARSLRQHSNLVRDLLGATVEAIPSTELPPEA